MTSLNQQPIKTKVTNKPFFGKYRYSISFDLYLADLLRGIRAGRAAYNELETRFSKRANGWHVRSTWAEPHSKDDDDLIALYTVCHLPVLQAAYFILQALEDARIVIHYESVTVYSNSLDLVSVLPDITPACRITEVSVMLPPDSIYKKRSKWSFRMMLKGAKNDEDSRRNVLKFIETYGTHISPSPALVKWSGNTSDRAWYKYTQPYYFIDIDDRKLESLFDLVAPGYRGRTFTIVNETEVDKY